VPALQMLGLNREAELVRVTTAAAHPVTARRRREHDVAGGRIPLLPAQQVPRGRQIAKSSPAIGLRRPIFLSCAVREESDRRSVPETQNACRAAFARRDRNVHRGCESLTRQFFP